MRTADKTYKILREITNHIPYKDIEIDIEALRKVGGGDFIIGIRKYGTTCFYYRAPRADWTDAAAQTMENWPETEWYAGSTNEGWIVGLSDHAVMELLTSWVSQIFGD